jgi:pimeloyl-ACP methyl ester carboxylesterase
MLKKALLSLSLFAAAVPSFAAPYIFSVRTVGEGKPVILIPGLTCSGDVWNGTVDRLKSHYRCYVLTLPGFGGQAPISGPYLPQVRDQIIAFVKDNHLDHPAVIGHSLGGFMTLYLGSTEPDLFGPLISVDGLPYLSAMFDPTMTPDRAKAMANGVSAGMKNATPDQFKQNVKAALDSEITDPKNAATLYPECEKADPTDTGQAVADMMTTDLRQDIARIKAPLLLIGVGGWLPNDPTGLKKTYQAQLVKCPAAHFVFDQKSRHFVMLDDPIFFYKTVQDFLARTY